MPFGVAKPIARARSSCGSPTSGSPALVDRSAIVVAPLAPLDTLAQPVVRREDATARPAPFELPLRPGRYLLDARAFGYEGRTDTVDVRPGASDTVTVALEEYGNALRNQHNCRPRGFRRAGERACITDQITTVVVLDRARDMAAPRFRYGVGLPAGDSTNVRIVDDERICERAARVYGLDTGPPRRVVVVDAVGFLVVYDPGEPVAFGELQPVARDRSTLPRAGAAGAVTRAGTLGVRAMALTLLALVAFASNSLLTRLALGSRQLDAASFTALRLGSGAVMLAAIVLVQSRSWRALGGSGLAGPIALFAYAAPFSFAYLRIGAAVGALVLFGVVQLTMIGYGIARGERPTPVMWLGLALAASGLLVLTVPAVARPDPLGVMLMAVAGVAWAVYTLVGRGTSDPIAANARSFLWSTPLAMLLVALGRAPVHATWRRNRAGARLRRDRVGARLRRLVPRAPPTDGDAGGRGAAQRPRDRCGRRGAHPRRDADHAPRARRRGSAQRRRAGAVGRGGPAVRTSGGPRHLMRGARGADASTQG